MHFLCIVCINMPPHFCAVKLVSHTLLTLREGRALIVWLELGENNYSDSQDAFSDTQSGASKRFPLFHIPTKQSHRFAWCMVVFFPLLCCLELPAVVPVLCFHPRAPETGGASATNCLQVTCAACGRATRCPSENPPAPLSPLAVGLGASSSSLLMLQPPQLCKRHNAALQGSLG